MIRLAVLISGRGSNMICLANAIRTYGIRAEIAIVISNKDCTGIKLAQRCGLPTQIIKREDFFNQAHQELAISDAINYHKANYIFLAGYMAILGDDFVGQFFGQLVNIHPSLLPALKGLNTHQRAIDGGIETHGVSIHLVTTALDDGPIILQASLPMQADETSDRLAARVLELEHQIYPFVLFGLAEKFLFLSPEGARWRSPLSALAVTPAPMRDLLAPSIIWPAPATSA
ncbi:phosphoribosylglycinamide formyltransferase [Candidatus Puniceispirillum sp.]|nr:phosphoribosylglycinamide formyltransferase [Candidatus Puniceispirillum sp.]